MSNPPEPTNLTQKFAALQEQMTVQHNALLEKIAEMRGEGPENTLKSVNQSLWNIAGPAPGTNLTSIYDAINLIRGDGETYPLTSLSQLRYAIDSIRGDEGVKSLADLHAQLVIINNTTDSIRGDEGERTLADIWLVLTDLLLQFNTSIVYPTMKDLMLTISQQQAELVLNTGNPINIVPAGVCASPFKSTGMAYLDVGVNLTVAQTLARWPETSPFAGITTAPGGFAVGQTTLKCDDWSQYKIYVASTATEFSVAFASLQKFHTNQWITLSGDQDLEIATVGDHALIVYICPVDAPGAVSICDGYGTLQQYGPFSFIPGTIDGNDTYKSYQTGVVAPPLSVSQLTYYANVSDTIEFISSDIDRDVCVTLVCSGSCGYTVVIARSPVTGYAIHSHQVFHTGIANESRSWIMPMVAGELYTIMATDIEGTLELYLTPQVVS